MATFDDRKHIDQFIKNNGYLDDCLDDIGAPDNPAAVKIVEYKNMGGKTAYGVVFEGGHYTMYDFPSEFIRDPKIIWERP